MNTVKNYYYPFAVKSERCVGSCNTLNDIISNKVYVSNKIKNLNLNIFNIITGINKSKTLTKHISCKCKCRLDGRKCNSNQSGIMVNAGASVKTLYMWKKDTLNPAACSCENGKYLASTTDNSVITRYKITDAEETKTVTTIFNEKKQPVRQKISIFYLPF